VSAPVLTDAGGTGAGPGWPPLTQFSAAST
jgi:hypothetical protein